MSFISSSEVNNAYFMRSNKWLIYSKILNFLFIIYNFKRDRFFALNDVIHARTIRHINDDIA